MKKIITIPLFIFLTSISFAQFVTVLNNTDQQPVANVYIFSNNHSTTTNFEGKASLNGFEENSNIVFQHASFKRRVISYSSIKENNFIVRLQESVLNIDEIVVSASQWEQKKSEVPNKILTVQSREIQFANAQTSADILSSSDKVFVQKSQMGGGSPMLRGFAANEVLLVVDGVRMNNAIYRSGNLQNVISLDANSIENSEVILGPGSVIYGSDAIGGVIDFHTYKPKLSTSEKLNVFGQAFLRYSSANFEKTAHIHFNMGTQKLAAITSVSFSDYDDLKMGSLKHENYTRPEFADFIDERDSIIKNEDKNIQKFTAYSQVNLLQKFRFRPSDNWDFEYALHISKLSDVPRYDRLIQYSENKLKYAEWYYGPQKWMMNSFKITNTKATPFFDRAKVIIAHQRYEESRHDRKFNSAYLRNRYEKVGLYTANIDFEKKLKNAQELYFGIEYNHNAINSNGNSKSIFSDRELKISSRYPDSSLYNALSFYISPKYHINEKVTLTGGIRFNQFYLYAPFDTTFYPLPFNKISLNSNAFNGSFGAVFKMASTTRFLINFSTGFRAPNIDDIGKIFDSEPGNVIVPNSNLKPQYVYNFETGFITAFFNRLQFETNIFYTYVNNVMVRSDFTFNGLDSIVYDGVLSKVEALVNADFATLYGFNFSVYADVTNHVSFKAHINVIEGQDQDNNPLRHVTPAFGGAHLIYTRNYFKADLYALYNGEVSNNDLSASERAKPHMYASDINGEPYSPAWYTINLKTSLQVNKKFQLNMGVENILDVRYRPYSSGIVAPGRNFILTLRSIF